MVVGGYSGGSEEYINESSVNGKKGIDSDSSRDMAGSGGSGYFEKANDKWTKEQGGNFLVYWDSPNAFTYREVAGPIGGGGTYTRFNVWSYSFSGDGGVAGKGGTIRVSPTAIVEAYNGNKYTDGSGNIEYCPIYIQNGELLKITTSLGFWTDQDNRYYSALFGTEVNYTTTWGTENGNDHVAELRDYSTDESLKLSYTDPVTSSNQGIGSGAGYIELSNGTYEVDSALN